jgi:GNAT superfamily N-acetyltransferase
MADVTIWYLAMDMPEQLRSKTEANGMVTEEARVKQFQVNRFLYQFVGENWQWNDKSGWSTEDWQAYAECDNLRTWMARVDGSVAGYFELKKHENAVTELAYFGLTPSFVGKGYGGYMLTQAVNQAWSWGATERVIVDTCSLDHPSALANYKARGFSVYREEQVTK